MIEKGKRRVGRLCAAVMKKKGPVEIAVKLGARARARDVIAQFLLRRLFASESSSSFSRAFSQRAFARRIDNERFVASVRGVVSALNTRGKKIAVYRYARAFFFHPRLAFFRDIISRATEAF